ncbi:hypothetical protein RBH26_20805 [Natronolimnohabitans sp. A-GB9]|uniref:hypothetical protein n=1 Tax=Natronolimnohabitans sp. A-GB9 TaxID=3069757 RepID=UPI0027B0AC71|nr:hypothetical protein [Natronolimnohabitans sp. A-GB9]MDQ2052885.1 hypothetical protein [Natronolimnohabitans sp. A-GB9]
MNSKYSSYQSSTSTTSTNTTSSGSDDGYDRDAQLKWKPNASFRGVLDSVYAGDNKWGQSLGIKFTDGKLVDGVLMERLDESGEADGTLKLFAWEQMPVILDESLSADDAPDVFTEEIVGKTYKYQLVGARVEGEESSDPEDTIDFGDFIMWEDGGKKPSSTAKVLAQMLTNLGRDSIVDRNDIMNWLAVNRIEAREDLLGRELEVFKVVKQGDKHDFHSPVVIDTKTGEQVRIGNGGSSPASSESQSNSPEPATKESSVDTSDLVSDLPEPVADFIEFCQDFGLSDEDQIRTNLTEMAEEDGNSLTGEMVDEVGEDEIVATILG